MYYSVPDPDFEIRGEGRGGSSRHWEKGEAQSPKFSSAHRASGCLKINGEGGGGTGPSPRSATVTIYLYSKITLQSKLWTSKPTTIRLRKIRSLDKSKTSRPCVLYPHISRGARSESGVKPVFCLAIFACHEVTTAIVRAIHPDLQTFKFN